MLSSSAAAPESSEHTFTTRHGPRSLTRASCVVFDPLDGSSNIDAGVNVGTIFGVYKVVGRVLVALIEESG